MKKKIVFYSRISQDRDIETSSQRKDTPQFNETYIKEMAEIIKSGLQGGENK